MPSQSQYSQPRLRDTPLKTRSTPQATLVVDLVSSTLWTLWTNHSTEFAICPQCGLLLNDYSFCPSLLGIFNHQI